jgi:hypothetical protein
MTADEASGKTSRDGRERRTVMDLDVHEMLKGTS